MRARSLPARPNILQLRHQAKDLLRAVRDGDVSALADFREYHPERIEPASAKLADAQLVLARSYQVASWPRLVSACELIDALWRDDLDAVQRLAVANVQLESDSPTTADAGWRAAMSEAANHGVRRIMGMLREHGARGVEEALARPELRSWLDTIRLLCRLGGRFPNSAIGGAVETLHGANFAFMIESGTEINDQTGDWRSRVALALETYNRNPAGKHRILEVMSKAGIPLPDTPPMAVHRGRIDLLENHLRRDPNLVARTFSLAEFYPPTLGCHGGDAGFHGTPLAGATLLHMAVDYDEMEIARWLLDRGMDVNARAAVDDEGFGGHTALFSSVVSYAWYVRSKYASPKPDDDPYARLLLDRGADPSVRASLRSSMHDNTVHIYRDVTPLSWGERFHARELVSLPAMQMIRRLTV